MDVEKMGEAGCFLFVFLTTYSSRRRLRGNVPVYQAVRSGYLCDLTEPWIYGLVQNA